MAIYTLHVLTVNRHMHVHVACRFKKRLFQIPMLNIIPTAAEKVTGSAIGALRPAHVLRNHCQIYGYIGHPRVGLDVRIAVVMTSETIYIVGILEIESRTVVTITNMATVAARFVARNSDTKVIQDVPLTHVANAFAFDIFGAFPIPMTRLHHFFMPFRMAGNAGFGDILGSVKMFLQNGKPGVIHGRFCFFPMEGFELRQGRAVVAFLGQHTQREGERGSQNNDDQKYALHNLSFKGFMILITPLLRSSFKRLAKNSARMLREKPTLF
jgi:hypothetical protein